MCVTMVHFAQLCLLCCSDGKKQVMIVKTFEVMESVLDHTESEKGCIRHVTVLRQRSKKIIVFYIFI